MSEMSRASTPWEAITITASAATTGQLAYQGLAHAVIYVPTGSSLTSLAFHNVAIVGGAEVVSTNAHKDESGTAISLTVAAATSYPMPTALSGGDKWAIVGNTTGTVYVHGKG
jgi:hypothetical protein